MSSLEAVNKTLGRIEEDTDLLNRNFHKWFLTQERSKLDAEEDRRERNKLLAMLGTAGAAGAGRGGRGGGKASGGMNPLGFLNNLPPWAKLLLGVYAGKAAYGAYKVATAPVTAGNYLGQTAVNYYDARQRQNIEAAEAIRQAKRKAETDRLLDELKAASESPVQPQAPQLDYTSSGMRLSSPDAPLTASRTPPSSPSTATKIETPEIITKALFQNAPKIQTSVSDLQDMRIILNGEKRSYWEKGRGFIPVNEAVSRLQKAGLDAKGNPIPMLLPRIETDFTVDTRSAPPVENKFTPIGKDGPRATPKVSPGGVALAGLGIFDAADTINSIIEETYGPQSVLNPNPTATGGALFVNTLGGLLQAGGEAFDLVARLYGAATGKDSETNIGQTLGDFVRNSETGRRLAGQGNEVGLNPTLAATASTLAENTNALLEHVINGVGIIAGTTTSDEIQAQMIKEEIAKGRFLAEIGVGGPMEMSDAGLEAAARQLQAAMALQQAAQALAESGYTGRGEQGSGYSPMPFTSTSDTSQEKLEAAIKGSPYGHLLGAGQ